MTWVRFHEELCEGEKVGIPRATRFVYMELSMRARPRRGLIVLPQGMPDVKAVQLLLSGNAKEVATAVATLSADPDPMIRFEDIEGKRVLVVLAWETWNPSRDDSRDRVAKSRERKRREECNTLHGVSVTPESSDVTALQRDEQGALARARALISPLSPLGSSSEPDPRSSLLSTGPAPLASPARRNATADGAFGLAVSAFADGVRGVTGGAFSLPAGGSAELSKLVGAIVDHCPAGDSRVEWARESGAAWATAYRAMHKTLSAHGFVDWLNSGRPTELPSGARLRTVQPVPDGGRAWKIPSDG